ncbi:SDR family NAD(P)-dependent oxidoreductase [Saccharicrinis sp. FJH2]|uniref:SDR family NAD(P)-dependent oxidoreductase n=1 Tax=Saccharicrinis sp. FJH65 TaxID=3344659 RepID=UPI0035F39ADE
MDKSYLVLGATGGIGYAFTNELIANGIRTSVFVRNEEKAKALFGNNPLIEIIVGDVTNREELKKAASNKNFIFCGINTPYQMWETQMERIISNVIASAGQNRSTILFPENNYAFGNIGTPITENMVPQPGTKKGKIRLNLVNRLQAAADKKECKVVIIRLPDFFGPNVTNGLIKPIFNEAVNNKPVKWMINADIPHQFAYTPDVARYFYLLSQEDTLQEFFLINYGGITVDSMKTFSKKISEIQGNPDHVKTAPKLMLNILGLFIPELKELKENFYQFENSIILDDSKLKKMYPKVRNTSLEDALENSLQWSKNNSHSYL